MLSSLEFLRLPFTLVFLSPSSRTSAMLDSEQPVPSSPQPPRQPTPHDLAGLEQLRVDLLHCGEVMRVNSSVQCLAHSKSSINKCQSLLVLLLLSLLLFFAQSLQGPQRAKTRHRFASQGWRHCLFNGDCWQLPFLPSFLPTTRL